MPSRSPLSPSQIRSPRFPPSPPFACHPPLPRFPPLHRRKYPRRPSSPATMPIKTKLTEMLGIEVPIVQGGMHHVGYAEMAAAVSNAGGLGIITSITIHNERGGVQVRQNTLVSFLFAVPDRLRGTRACAMRSRRWQRSPRASPSV